MSRNTAEVIIIGASLAGASAALALALRGVRVAVIDKEMFPRRKPCGEGISFRALGALEELGCGELLRSLPKHPFRYFDVYSRGGHTRLGDPIADVPLGLGIAREVLDAAVVQKLASFPNVRLLTGTTPRLVERRGSGFGVAVGEEQLTSSFLVLAEGGRGLYASRLGIPAVRRITGRYGFSTPYTGPYRKDSVSIIVERDYEAYITPVGEDQICVACLGNKDVIRDLIRDEKQRVVNATIATVLGSGFRPAAKPLGVGELGAVRRASFSDGVFLVGDCCEAFDPIGGMGMTHAVLSGRSCGNAIAAAINGALTATEAAQRYDRDREAIARPLRGLTTVIGFSLHQDYSAQLLKLIGWLKLDQAAHDLVLKAQRSAGRIGVRTLLSQLAVNAVGRAKAVKLAA